MVETIREFAWERLAGSGEREAMRRAHADYFVQLGAGSERAWWDSEGRERVDAMETEITNIRAARLSGASEGHHEHIALPFLT